MEITWIEPSLDKISPIDSDSTNSTIPIEDWLINKHIPPQYKHWNGLKMEPSFTGLLLLIENLGWSSVIS